MVLLYLLFLGFIYGCYRIYEGENYDTTVLKDEKGLTSINSSMGEMQFVLYKFHKLCKPRDFYSKFTSVNVERIGTIIPDYYCPGDKLVGFFHGCR